MTAIYDTRPSPLCGFTELIDGDELVCIRPTGHLGAHSTFWLDAEAAVRADRHPMPEEPKA